MNEQTLKENIRTLAAILGVDAHAASEMLNESAALIFDEKNLASSRFAYFLNELLSRTIKKVTLNPVKSEPRDVSIFIGNIPRSGEGKQLYAGIWSDRIVISRTSIERDGVEEVHPILLLLGACYAAAQIVKLIAGDMLQIPYDDPLEIDFPSIIGDVNLSEDIDIGNAHLAGAGAIGNGFVLALTLLNPMGVLHIADPDVVDDGNLNRCVWFKDNNVGYNKAQQLVEIAQPKFEKLKLIAHPCELQQVPEKSEGAWLERLIIGVDSRRVRRNLQNEIPGEIYDASTTDIREVVLHFNRQPLEGFACMSCIYFQDTAESAHEQHVAEALGVSLEDVQSNFISADAAKKICQQYTQVIPGSIEGLAYDSLFKQLCGEGALNTPEDKQVLAPLSFVSVLAGTYLAIEFAKRLQVHNPIKNFNYWKVSPWSQPNLRARKIRYSKYGCEFCGDPILIEVANSLWS